MIKYIAISLIMCSCCKEASVQYEIADKIASNKSGTPYFYLVLLRGGMYVTKQVDPSDYYRSSIGDSVSFKECR